MTDNEQLKDTVRRHWEKEVSGTRHGRSEERQRYLREIEESRYTLEPYIPSFADFPSAAGKELLEVGVGAGCDFANWVRNGARATGIDFADAAVEVTSERLRLEGVPADRWKVLPGDAEDLPFEGSSFDIVYSWGVLMHVPDTPKALEEIRRVLRPGGELRAMVYREPSWVGWLLWIRWCLFGLKPWKSVKWASYHHLESPGTKLYRDEEVRAMLRQLGFVDIRLRRQLSFGDLLGSGFVASEKYRSPIYKIARFLYPRWLVRLTGSRLGLYLLVRARKPQRQGGRQRTGHADTESGDPMSVSCEQKCAASADARGLWIRPSRSA